MAFKMKNKSVMKLTKEAGNNRTSPMKQDDLPPLPGSYEAVMAGDDLFAYEKLIKNMRSIPRVKKYMSVKPRKQADPSLNRLLKKIKAVEAKYKLEKNRQTGQSLRNVKNLIKDVPSKKDRG